MPRITDLDTFIQRSASILDARPDTSRVSLTYKHVVKKTDGSADPKKTASNEDEDEDSATAQAVLYAKTFDPVSGVCFRIKLTRTKQLNRLLSALGPRGVEITKVTKSRKRTQKKAKLDEDTKMEDVAAAPAAPADAQVVVREKGISLIMTNTEYVEKREDTPVAEAVAEVKEAAKDKKETKKDGKKKGKKNRK